MNLRKEEWMNEYMNELLNACMQKWMNERISQQMGEWTPSLFPPGPPQPLECAGDQETYDSEGQLRFQEAAFKAKGLRVGLRVRAQLCIEHPFAGSHL